MTQLMKVRSNELDQSEFGPEYQVHYLVREAAQEDWEPHPGQVEYQLWDDDGHGNGDLLAIFPRKRDAMQICQKLGQVIEYAEGVRPKPVAP